MRKFRTVYCLILILLILVGCNSSHTEGDPFLQYKDSYVGDNTAVGNIVRQLPTSDDFNGFELKTIEEPYGIVLKYDGKDDAIKETMVYNATFIFTLVKNADWISFDFGNQSHIVTRNELQEWYGEELGNYTNEEELIKLIHEHLQDKDKVKKFLKNNPIL